MLKHNKSVNWRKLFYENSQTNYFFIGFLAARIANSSQRSTYKFASAYEFKSVSAFISA